MSHVNLMLWLMHLQRGHQLVHVDLGWLVTVWKVSSAAAAGGGEQRGHRDALGRCGSS
jgi:hypothetical protein